MKLIDVLIGTVVGIVLTFGAYTINSHYKEKQFLQEATTAGCTVLGPPPADSDFARFVRNGFSCGNMLFLLTK
jgi:hypothetical protein